MPTKRREFSDKVKLEIWRRAGGPDDVRCENCGWKIRGRNFDYDHRVAEWILEDIEIGLRGPLTAADGWLLGNRSECGCHGHKTDQEAPQRAHVNRVRKKAAKAKKAKRPMSDPNMKKTMGGVVIDRRTGLPWGQGDGEE